MKVTTTSILTWPAKLVLGLFISFTIASSCSDPSTIGLELDPNNNQIGVSFIEIPLSASVVLQDSFRTTNTNNLVFGSDESDFFGNTEATAYTRLFFNRELPRPSPNAVLDSVKFNFNIRSVLADEFSSEKTIRVHPLKEQIRDIVYYSFNHLNYEETPFLEAKIDVSARQDTIISVKADSDFTTKIFTDLKEGTSFQDIFTFREYLPGLVFTGSPEENVSMTLRPGNNTGIIFFYRNEEDTVSRAYPLATGVNNNVARHFNQIERNPEGSNTEILREPWVSYELDGKAGSMNNTGILVKIDMSPLDDFLDTIQNVTFNQAILELGPILNVTDTRRPPQLHTMYFTNETNRVLLRDDGRPMAVHPDNFPQIDQETGEPIFSETPAYLAFNSETNKYRQTITSHINAIYRRQIERRDFLLYPIVSNNDEYRQSLRSYVFNSNEVKIRIFYSTARVF
ncbi:hypothetical protein A33Q_4311 [Indibacter alkaliphilus LW1]|uniref:DUF4270 domain-containing protein n=1 Tax=Indibacter alkaliphilus (strain CCUG 57479 / KCTC 22604 / LW1) TaxID=1189612 RepID=S2DQQ7_INDAL|nr:DUF4270 family protein [Indibacter alkaliphilus]EOZ92218.1 hypothetical protein A33Q_4311 [Indibacter alkaliphilus LW1]